MASTIANGPIPQHPMFLQGTSFGSNTNLSARSNNRICEGPSKLSGPIVSNYQNDIEKEMGLIMDYSKNPRVRDAGQANFNKSKNDKVGFLIELQGRAVDTNLKSYKFREPSKNHIHANAIKIKQLMRKVKEREAQKEKSAFDFSLYGKTAPVKGLWKSAQYKDVQSKLKDLLLQEPLTPRIEKANFLKAHSRTGSPIANRPQSARQAPRENTSQNSMGKKYGSKDDIDFVKRNQTLAKDSHMKRAPSVENLKQVQEKLNNDLRTYEEKNLGKIPNYLEQRKEQLRRENEELIKNMPDPEQPPGHRKLPDDEKQKTMNLLKETKNKLLSEMNSLPIRSDTFRIKTTKNDMEKKLVELDQAIEIFSKPKVFIKID